ncbi:MAG: hypothetical protein IKL96_03940 [Kiritimatiellae bacterium]|nr:hypothetical protein [Kiritimatiellia bacterium]
MMCVADPADGWRTGSHRGRRWAAPEWAAGYVVTSTDGDTALFVYPRGGGAKFFRPAIRQR